MQPEERDAPDDLEQRAGVAPRPRRRLRHGVHTQARAPPRSSPAARVSVP